MNDAFCAVRKQVDRCFVRRIVVRSPWIHACCKIVRLHREILPPSRFSTLKTSHGKITNFLMRQNLLLIKAIRGQFPMIFKNIWTITVHRLSQGATIICWIFLRQKKAVTQAQKATFLNVGETYVAISTTRPMSQWESRYAYCNMFKNKLE